MTIFKENEKKLKFVKVYGRLYEKIQNGFFSQGTQLPSETILAQELGVSRMTLRQALSVLRDDGLIRNVQGIGNFVTRTDNDAPSHLTILSNPIYTSCSIPLENFEIRHALEVPPLALKQTMNITSPAIVNSDRWYRSGDNVLGYSLSLTPIEVITKYNIDLADSNALNQFLDKDIYSHAHKSTLLCRVSNAGNFVATKYKISTNNSFIVMSETLYSETMDLLNFSKHYIPIHLYHVQLQLTR